MDKEISLGLTQNLYQLMKLFPRPKIRQANNEKLSRSEYDLLLILAITLNEEHDSMTVSEISNLLQITPAGVTHLANALEEAGYIERIAEPNDRRVVRIRLTSKASKGAKLLTNEVHEHLKGLVEHLGVEDSQTLVRLLTRSVEFFSKIKADPTII